MNNKFLVFFGGVALLVAFGLCYSSCKKETGQSTPWVSLNFAGNFSGTENCLLSGTRSNNISITAINATQVSINNLYGFGKSVTGNISHDSCIIQPQICDTLIMQGMALLSSDTLTLFIIASSFGKEEKCNAVLIKQ